MTWSPDRAGSPHGLRRTGPARGLRGHREKSGRRPRLARRTRNRSSNPSRAEKEDSQENSFIIGQISMDSVFLATSVLRTVRCVGNCCSEQDFHMPLQVPLSPMS
eukprot:2632723-Pyramimonas_sp.AAC.2